ncbi:MAG: SM-20-related protein [Limisphaerales bacterium]|jgi:SM-20-related protein
MTSETEQRNEHDQFETLVQGLIDNEYGCCDIFFDINTISGLRDNINLLKESASMQAAGIGNKKSLKKDELYRGDKIKWLSIESIDQYEILFLKKIGKFVDHLNKTCFTSIKNFETHYASYEKNSFYKRHLDQFKNDTSRQYSIILYLNDTWLSEDGGMLSLYLPENKQKDVLPIGGRMMFFKSAEMEHEVHPSFTRDRISIAGWFKN